MRLAPNSKKSKCDFFSLVDLQYAHKTQNVAETLAQTGATEIKCLGRQGVRKRTFVLFMTRRATHELAKGFSFCGSKWPLSANRLLCFLGPLEATVSAVSTIKTSRCIMIGFAMGARTALGFSKDFPHFLSSFGNKYSKQ